MITDANYQDKLLRGTDEGEAVLVGPRQISEVLCLAGLLTVPQTSPYHDVSLIGVLDGRFLYARDKDIRMVECPMCTGESFFFRAKCDYCGEPLS